MKYLKSSSCLPLHWLLETLKRYMPLNEMFFECVSLRVYVYMTVCVVGIILCVGHANVCVRVCMPAAGMTISS